MAFEIYVHVWVKPKIVAGVNRSMGSHAHPLAIIEYLVTLVLINIDQM
jgi:hypothetical protein